MVRINFEDGKPVGFEKFLEGFLLQQVDGKYGYLGRLAGVAVGKDGSLFVADDSNGVIYRVCYVGDAKRTERNTSVVPNTVAEVPASRIASELVNAERSEPIAVKAPFEADNPIPPQYSAEGHNASPSLQWAAVDGAKSYVVISDDPDAAKPKPFVHWVAYDIPATTTRLREGIPGAPVLQDPKDMRQGANSMGSIGYTGPKPPVGDPAHHYYFQVFALDVATLGLQPGAKREDVLEAMGGHVLAEGQMVGTFKRETEK